MPTYEQSTRPEPGTLKIVELFTTVQGEGERIGVPSTFVRTGMCNLECAGCDTKWDKWNVMPISEVARQVRAFDARHVVLSGGEPTLWQNDLADLLKLLPGFHVTVETNGSVPLRNTYLLQRVDLWSFSPKVGSLGFGEKFSRYVVLDNLLETEDANQIKFVLNPDVPEHVDSVFAFIERLNGTTFMPDDRIYFQPYDTETLVNIAHVPGLDDVQAYMKRLSKLTELVMKRSGARYRVLPQLHKFLAWR